MRRVAARKIRSLINGVILMSFGIFVVRDYNKNLKQVSLEGPSITDGASYTAATALFDALQAALEDLALGVVADAGQRTVESTSNLAPAESTAQTNINAVVHYHQDLDSTKTRTFKIPTFDISDETLFIGTTTILNPANTEVADFITAFEAYALIEGLSVTVDTIEYVNN